MKFLSFLAKACAILAGLLLTVITLITCASLIGRNTTGTTLLGDYELTAVAAGAAVALFMPWCQLRRENIIVDFFTTKFSDSFNAKLDRVGSLVLGLAMFAICWRTGIGGMSAYESQTTTMMLGFPEWVVYAAMVPPFVLCALIALAQTFSAAADDTGAAA